jgi:hypothetical protein
MKRLQKTEFITKRLAAAVGPDVETASFPVWEVSATNTKPLRGKDGTIFEKAVIKPQTLFQLASLVNQDAAPLMQDHNMEGAPKGKFFYAEALPDGYGDHELRGFLYADPTEYDLAAKIDNGTVDEVSVAFAAEKMTCSECGWDYAKAIEQDDIMPVLTRTCENGHVIGKNGVHVELEGVRDMLELSVVSRGAAKNSKIIGQSDSKLSKQVERLAAHGLSINDRYVTASASRGFDNMDMENLIVQLTDAKSKAQTAEEKAARLEREHADAVGARNEAEARARDLEQELAAARAEAAAAPSAEEREQAAKDSKDTKASINFLKGQYVAVMTAAGESNPQAPDTVEELIEGIKSKHTELSAILPIGGVTYSSNSEDKHENAVELSVFKTRDHVQR